MQYLATFFISFSDIFFSLKPGVARGICRFTRSLIVGAIKAKCYNETGRLSYSRVDCKTAPSFARSPKSGVFERVLARGREMGERVEEGVARPGEKGILAADNIFRFPATSH